MLAGDDTNAPFCLWAFAIDSHNAMKAFHLAVVPQNEPPNPQIIVVAPDPVSTMTTATGVVGTYALYSTIQVSDQGSTDPEGDSLTPVMWTFTQKPSGSNAAFGSCSSSDQCSFTADVPGEYDVLFKITDGMAQNTVTRPIIINSDQPPCIQTTDPDFLLETPLQRPAKTPDKITVLAVTDDGDSYPGTTTTQFFWSSSLNKQSYAPYSNDFHLLPLPGYNIGDVLKVRLEVHDRNPATANALFGCRDADFCAIDARNPGCFQRVTWTIEFE